MDEGTRKMTSWKILFPLSFYCSLSLFLFFIHSVFAAAKIFGAKAFLASMSQRWYAYCPIVRASTIAKTDFFLSTFIDKIVCFCGFCYSFGVYRCLLQVSRRIECGWLRSVFIEQSAPDSIYQSHISHINFMNAHNFLLSNHTMHQCSSIKCVCVAAAIAVAVIVVVFFFFFLAFESTNLNRLYLPDLFESAIATEWQNTIRS